MPVRQRRRDGWSRNAFMGLHGIGTRWTLLDNVFRARGEPDCARGRRPQDRAGQPLNTGRLGGDGECRWCCASRCTKIAAGAEERSQWGRSIPRARHRRADGCFHRRQRIRYGGDADAGSAGLADNKATSPHRGRHGQGLRRRRLWLACDRYAGSSCGAVSGYEPPRLRCRHAADRSGEQVMRDFRGGTASSRARARSCT